MTIHQQRRVVTGVNSEGKAVFVEDGAPPVVVTMESFPGNEFFMIWGTDDSPDLPTEGKDPTVGMTSFSPGPHGTRFLINRWPPGTEFSGEQVDGDAHRSESPDKMPGISDSHEHDDIQMHTTDTIDYAVVIKGEMWCELDDGATVHLKQGDCFIQNGTRHAWRNRSDQECVMAFVMVGANRAQA